MKLTTVCLWTCLARIVGSADAYAAERVFPKDVAGPTLREDKTILNARAKENEAAVKKIPPTVPRVEVAPGKFKTAIFDTFRSPKVVSGKHFWLSAGFDGSPQIAKNLGFQTSVGYQRNLIGPVIKFRYASIDFGHFSPSAGQTDLTSQEASFTSAASELNRFRRSNEPWSALCLDLGIEINGNLMGDWIPNSSQRGTFTLGAGRWSDTTNSLGFTSIQMSVEAGFQYHFAPRSRFALELAGTFTSGWMATGGLFGESGQPTRLPISWPSAGLNILLFL